eukprot:TRINITY_DN1114_c5_g1_i1.p1 TRINITY_DN1114_c5_g1~~TRINITY_DN1114_c5_g1_i1.p1  ORF type:complete len:653 (+),score=156.04 TRINITY_DN1114_c5_g1_i1:56-2014(+)
MQASVFERLKTEYQQLETSRGKDVYKVDLVEENLCVWEVRMKFQEGTNIQKELDHYGDKVLADKTKKCLVLRLYFPGDYPVAPPEVRVVEPRLDYFCEVVTFGGVFKTVLIGHDWTENLTARDIVKDIHLRLAMCEVKIAPASRLLRPYHPKHPSQDPNAFRSSSFPTVNNFNMQFKVIPAKEAANTFHISGLDESDRICLPTSLMPNLYHEHTKLPIIFEIATQEGRVRHMGISDKHSFVEYLPANTVIVPDWIHAELRIAHKSMDVNVRCVQLKAVEQLLLQPHDASFYKDMEACSGIGNTQAVLNQAMKDSKLTALTVNSAVKIEVPKPGGAVSHMLEILHVYPPGAGRLISSAAEDQWEVSFKVEFAPAPDFEDEDDYKKRMNEIETRMLTKERAKAQIASQTENARREELMNTVMMQRCELEDEMPSVGKRGEVDVKLTLPDGTQMDGKFKEGAKVSSITAFIMINADWVLNETVERSTITLSTAFPKKQLSVDETITTKDLHRQRVMVSRTSDSALTSAPEQAEPVAPQSPQSPETITRSNTGRLEAAWENATQQQKIRRTMRSEEASFNPAEHIDDMPPAAAPTPDTQSVAQGDFATQPTPEEMTIRVQTVSEITGNSDPEMIQNILEACSWDVERAVSLLVGGL